MSFEMSTLNLIRIWTKESNCIAYNESDSTYGAKEFVTSDIADPEKN